MYRQLASWTSFCAWLLTACGQSLQLPQEVRYSYDNLKTDLQELIKEAPWISHWEGEDTYVYWADLSPKKDTRVGQCTNYSGLSVVLMDPMRVRPSYRLATLGHELGHAMGLKHSADPESIMYPAAPQLTGKQAADSLREECGKHLELCRKLHIIFGRPSSF